MKVNIKLNSFLHIDAQWFIAYAYICIQLCKKGTKTWYLKIINRVHKGPCLSNKCKYMNEQINSMLVFINIDNCTNQP